MRLNKGDTIQFHTNGRWVDGFVSRVVTSRFGRIIGYIVDSPNDGSFYILAKESKLPAGAIVQYGSVQFHKKGG